MSGKRVFVGKVGFVGKNLFGKKIKFLQEKLYFYNENWVPSKKSRGFVGKIILAEIS